MANKSDSLNSGRSDEPKTLDIAAQTALLKDEIERFTRMSREKGFVTVEEINDLMPAEIIDSGVLDSFMSALDSAGVIITEPSQKKEGDEEGVFAQMAFGLRSKSPFLVAAVVHPRIVSMLLQM